MSNLTEGLRKSDLDDLILPIISIDEFESKIDNETTIVVGLYVNDIDPATDLSRFIEKSAVPILDTEVSPAPDEHGHYMVFIEFSRDKTFPKNLIDVIDSLKNVTNLEEYKFKAHKKKGKYELSEENLRRLVRLKIKPVKPKVEESVIYDFLQTSNLDKVSIVNETITLERRNTKCSFDIISFDEEENAMVKYKLDESPILYDDESLKKSLGVTNILGLNWSVNVIGDVLSISKDNDSRILLVK